jgi:hypothetical protein
MQTAVTRPMQQRGTLKTKLATRRRRTIEELAAEVRAGSAARKRQVPAPARIIGFGLLLAAVLLVAIGSITV